MRDCGVDDRHELGMGLDLIVEDLRRDVDQLQCVHTLPFDLPLFDLEELEGRNSFRIHVREGIRVVQAGLNFSQDAVIGQQVVVCLFEYEHGVADGLLVELYNVLKRETLLHEVRVHKGRSAVEMEHFLQVQVRLAILLYLELGLKYVSFVEQVTHDNFGYAIKKVKGELGVLLGVFCFFEDDDAFLQTVKHGLVRGVF